MSQKRSTSGTTAMM